MIWQTYIHIITANRIIDDEDKTYIYDELDINWFIIRHCYFIAFKVHLGEHIHIDKYWWINYDVIKMLLWLWKFEEKKNIYHLPFFANSSSFWDTNLKKKKNTKANSQTVGYNYTYTHKNIHNNNVRERTERYGNFLLNKKKPHVKMYTSGAGARSEIVCILD